MADDAVTITRFLGARNTLPGDRMPPTEEGVWLKSAINVDHDNAGRIARRQGCGARIGFGNVTAAYATEDETRLFVVDGGDLKNVASITPLSAITLASVGTGEVYWAEGGNLVFFTGSSTGIIQGNDVLPLGIPTPQPPQMVAVAGSLPPGKYIAAIAYRDAWGRQGGAGAVSEIELTETGGIRFVFDPLPGYVGLLFVSLANGDHLFLLAESAAGAYIWPSGNPTSYALDPMQMGSYPPPAGVGPVAFRDSRLWLSQNLGDTAYIFRSRPFWYHLFDLSDYIAVPGRIEMMLALDGALIIGTRTNIYAYSEDAPLATLADYGVVPGQPGRVIDRRAYFWTTRGLCAALPFENLTDKIFSVPPGTRAAIGVNESQGRKMLIVAADTGGRANNPN